MAILTKYSKTLDTQSSQYTSQKEYMESLATTNPKDLPDDFRTPFTYKEWIQRNAGIIPGKEYEQYNQYLKNWHQNTYTVTNTLDQVKTDYYELVNQLKVAFTTQEEEEWFKDLDITDDLDLEDAIPYFTKKLKEIAIYFVNKRDAIKKAKLKYNMSGSRNAIERLFYEYLLKAFTQRNYVLNVPEQSAYNTFPELSAVTNQFQIIIEELYDDTSYFDKDPMVAVSAYYDLTNSDVLDYFNSVSFDTSAMPWLFGTGVSEVYTDNPLIWTLSGFLDTYSVSSTDELPISTFSEFDYELLNHYVNMDGTEKYLGEPRYIISGGYYELDSRNMQYNFSSGNNWFYWPSGEYIRENVEDIVFDPIPLSSTSLIDSGATASLDYRNADKIFTQTGNEISGAWLKYSEKYTEPDTMIATLFEGETTRFRFPYPGYGLSGEGAEWTGPQLENIIPLNRYPEDVEKIYWATTPLSSIDVISIHDSTLVKDGSIAASEYPDADKISIRVTSNADRIHDTNPNEIYKEEFDRAWLYKMTRTDLPVRVGKTYINWPIHTYKENDTTLSIAVPSTQCNNVNLADIDVESYMVGARAGYGLADSDIIYKLDSFNGYPTECAFLSGGGNISSLASSDSTLIYNASGKIQPSLNLRCRPGRFEHFIWHDSDTYIDETSIVHHNHQTDCPYIINSHSSIYATRGKSILELGTNGIGDWDDCRCRAIKYSPLGHPGENYSEYSYMADIVFVDTQYPSEFDINTWTGTDGLAYDQSADFAWFQLTGNNVEPDVGWGKGRWKTGDGSRFEFTQGVLYRYLRANLLRSPGELILDAVPDLIVRQQYASTPAAQWTKAELNANGAWERTDKTSDMVLEPGTPLVYDHINSSWYCLTGEGTFGNTKSYNASALNPSDSQWSNFTYVTTGYELKFRWPDVYYNDGPSLIRAELSAVSWTATKPDATTYISEKTDPASYFKFKVEDIGEYSVQAIGYSTVGTETVTTPTVQCSQKLLTIATSGAQDVNTIYNDTINLTVNVPLYGWNYTDNIYDGNTTVPAARPFWAKAYDTPNDQTKNKATIAWGGGIRTILDDYTYLTQPDVATLELSSNYYVEYTSTGTDAITWNQPISFVIDKGTKQWCKLYIKDSIESPMTDYLYNITNEMVVSATEEHSDIVLSNEDDMFVNYWSVSSSLAWNQQIVDSTNGLPPTGGRWIPAISGELITPIVPYANLTNRYFPTIATMPYVGGLYSKKDSGGYFVPKMLGANVYIGRDFTNTLDTSLISNTVSARGLSGSFLDPTAYVGKGRGLSENNQVSPIATVDDDQRWQKGYITEGFKAGDVVGAGKHQEYIPYNTKYESVGMNFNGLANQDDQYDPWDGKRDNRWANPTFFPPNFRNEYDINGWYEERLPANTLVYQWKTDIFGNDYVLFKADSLDGVYEKRQAYGDMWVKGVDGVISPISAAFPTYDTYQDSTSSVNYEIIDFDVWYDTLMLKTSSHVIVEHINFDWDNNRLYTIADQINTINLQVSGGGKYGGHWLFDEDKMVTYCQVLSDATTNLVYPILYDYDIDTYERTTKFNLSGNSQINGLSALSLDYIEDPIFSYNKLTNTYNLSFVGYSSNYTGVIITSMNINNKNGLESVTSMVPNKV